MTNNKLVTWADRRLTDPFFNRFFDGFFSEGLPADARERWGFSPAVDLEETDQEFHLTFDLPGIDKKDVKIEIHDSHLYVSGERKEERKEKRGGYSVSERRFGNFQRTFRLPVSVAADKISATFDNGVLSVQIPKSDAAKPRQIEVK